jgi:hypothetical protein
MQINRETKKDICFLTGLLVLVLLFFWRAVFLGEYLIAGDMINQFLPWKTFLAKEFWATGRIPLWNPYTFSGNPFAANYQVGIWYPLDIIFFFVSAAKAFTISTILHFYLAGVFMYILSRHWKLDRAGAFASALLFTFGGFFVSRLGDGNYTLLTTYPWIPIIFYFFSQLLETGKWKYLAYYALAHASQILGGHPQPAYYTFVSLSVFVLWWMYEHWKQEAGWNRRFLPLGWYFLGALFVFALSAIQLLPSREIFQFSASRSGGAPYVFATSSSFSWKYLGLYFSPYIFGSPVDGTYWLDMEGYSECCGFTGILAVILAFIGLFSFQNKKSRFMGILVAVSFFFALGKYNPLYPFLYNIVIGLKMFRCPARWLMIIQFGLAFLAGAGVQALTGIHSLDEKARKRVIHVFYGAGILFILAVICYIWIYWDAPRVITGLYNHQVRQFVELYDIPANAAKTMIPADAMDNRYAILIQQFSLSLVFFLMALIAIAYGLYRKPAKGITGLLCGLLLIEMWNWGFWQVKTETPDSLGKYYQMSPDMQYLQSHIGLNRVLPLDSTCSWEYTKEEFEFRPNRMIGHQIQDIRGYDPTILKYYTEIINILQGFEPDFKQGGILLLNQESFYRPSILGLLNVQYIASIAPLKPSSTYQLEYQHRLLLYRNKQNLPRVFSVPRAIALHDRNERLQFMASDSFIPQEVLVLNQKEASIPASAWLVDTTQISLIPVLSSSVLNKGYGADFSKWEVELQNDGFLFFSEIWYPGWKAYDNGKEIPLYQANNAFRAVYLKSGHHQLELKFLPASFYWGKRITQLALLLAIGLVLISLQLMKNNKKTA